MEMQQLISVENQPARLSVNFDELKSALQTELEKYDIVVTVDTVADAKKLATELNATKKLIDDRRKDEVAKASEPVRVFDTKMKELVSLCSDGRQKILDQVARFEDETKKRVIESLINLRIELHTDFEVKPEYHKAEFDDLVKISALTAKGSLTKAVKTELEMRVREDRATQDRTERRLLVLENESLKAGLFAPLTREHVAHFLFIDDDEYQARLGRLISTELARQQQAEDRMRQQMARQQRQAEPTPEPESKPEPAPAKAEPVTQTKPAPTPLNNARHMLRVTASFDVPDRGIDHEAIKAELRNIMAKAGIKTLTGIEIERLIKSEAA